MDHTLEYLLGFDGRIHWLEQGYWLKFEIARTIPSRERPHGLRYSFTLHKPSGERILGFDNAHAVPKRAGMKARPVSHDHWHRTEADEGRPYEFEDADRLLADFFAEVRRVLGEHGIGDTVVGVTVQGRRR